VTIRLRESAIIFSDIWQCNKVEETVTLPRERHEWYLVEIRHPYWKHQ